MTWNAKFSISTAKMNWPPKAISSSLNDVTSDLFFRNSVMNIECCSIYQINAAVEPQLWVLRELPSDTISSSPSQG